MKIRKELLTVFINMIYSIEDDSLLFKLLYAKLRMCLRPKDEEMLIKKLKNFQGCDILYLLIEGLNINNDKLKEDTLEVIFKILNLDK